jgi:PAP2 superfamily
MTSIARATYRLAALVAIFVLASPAVARADAVRDWNVNATNAILTARQSPQVTTLTLAMVQGAVYDAVNAIDGGHAPYLAIAPANPWDSEDAAAATAAYRVLVALFPAQQSGLEGWYATSLATIPDGAAKDGGIGAGERAASAMLAAREHDGRDGVFPVPIGLAPGEWRPTPPAFIVDPTAWIADVLPFVVPSAEMLRTDGPNALTSAAYAEDFNEVKAVGALHSSLRTLDQTDAALFWQTNGPVLWNGVTRDLASRGDGLSEADAARLLAMVNLAAADAVIGCWNDKYFWHFWRPVTAIREASTDGNSATIADPDWSPLFATPPFPDHPSAHSCLSSAIVHTLQDFLGTDKLGFSAFSSNSGTTRSFERLSQALKEIVDARVWGGIHFRTADMQGTVLGKKVAHYLGKHYFEPVG